MIVTLLMLTLFSIYMLFMNHKSKYIRWLFLIVIFFGVTIVFLQLYISKFVNYDQRFMSSSNVVFSLDYWLWTHLQDVSVSANTITRIINISSAVFIYAVVVFSILYTREKTSKKTRIMIALLALLPLEIILFYDPLLSFQIFIKVSGTTANNENAVLNLVRALQIINYYLINLYFVYSLVILVIKYFRSKLKIKRSQILFIIAQILPISLMFLLIFIWIPIKDVDIYTYSIRLTFTPTGFTIPYSFFELLPVMAAGFMIVNIYLIARHQILYRMERQRTRTLGNRLREANENFQGVFHAFKNNFLAIKIMADRINSDQTDKEEIKKLGQDIGELCDEYISKINILQSKLKKVRISMVEIDLVRVIERLRQDIRDTFETDIEVEKPLDSIAILADELYLYEALRNFLVNSVEAVQGKPGGKIRIVLRVESEWVVIQIHDNGVGISAKTLKEMFKPFFSTKNQKNNWGIGLSYSKLVINSHGGDISVRSEENTYTSFEIVLPRVWR